MSAEFAVDLADVVIVIIITNFTIVGNIAVP